MLENIDWTNVAAWSITVVTSASLFIQTQRSNKYNKQRYEMSRRVNAANILYKWSESTTKEEVIVKRVVEKFNEQQVRSLLSEEKFKISKELYKKLTVALNKGDSKSTEDGGCCNACNEKEDRCDDCTNKDLVELTKEDVILVRWYVLHYLNNLECLLMHCKIGIVDQDLFFEQLRYQYNTRDGVMALKLVRNAVGGIEAYPAIEWFCIKLEEKMRKDILEKGYVEREV